MRGVEPYFVTSNKLRTAIARIQSGTGTAAPSPRPLLFVQFEADDSTPAQARGDGQRAAQQGYAVAHAGQADAGQRPGSQRGQLKALAVVFHAHLHAAVLAGHSVLFVSAADLLLDLAGQESARALERRLHYYAKIGLLVLDELGFLAFDNRNADLLFQVVSRRYEKKSIVLTTNLAFTDWHTIFPTATCATALIERIVHHADIVSIEGESYRLRESQNDAKERRTTRKPKK